MKSYAEGYLQAEEKYKQQVADLERQLAEERAWREIAVEALKKLRDYNRDIAEVRINYRPKDHIQVAEGALAQIAPTTTLADIRREAKREAYEECAKIAESERLEDQPPQTEEDEAYERGISDVVMAIVRKVKEL